MAPVELLVGSSLLLLVFLPFRRVNKKIGFGGRQIAEEWKKSQSALLFGIRNSFLLKAYGKQEMALSEGKTALSKIKKLYLAHYRMAAIQEALPVFSSISIVCLISFLSLKFIGTKPAILLGFFYVFVRLAQTASEANSVVANLFLYWPSFRHLYDWSMKLPNILPTREPFLKPLTSPDNAVHSVEARTLCFSYNNLKPVFTDVSFLAQRGAPLIIKGTSGSGKSSLLKLVLGIEHPTAGSLLINGHPIELVRSWLSASIGYVGPETYFVAGTVRENLLYPFNNHQVSDDEIWNTLSLCKLNQVVECLSGELDHYLTELTPLSTGQKQRLAMASALLRRPSLLVFDEATAHLDTKTESEFIKDLQPIIENKTSIIVTHKNSFDGMANATFLKLK
jgi:ABC-type bacteriocin/lantibiotic exporter with double-glycine peptidase domain